MDGRAVVAEGADVFQGGLPIRALGVDVVEQAHAAAPVRELDRVTRLGRLGQVRVAERLYLAPLGLDGGERGIHLRESLHGHGVANGVDAQGIRLGASDLALIAVEDPEGQTHAEANGVVRADALVLDLRGDVPPRVGLGQIDVRPRLLASRLRGPYVRSGVEGSAVELRLREGGGTVVQSARDVELFDDLVRPYQGAEGDLAGRERLPGVRGVPLQAISLDLDPEQLEAGEIALVGTEPLDLLEVIQGGQVLLGQGR